MIPISAIDRYLNCQTNYKIDVYRLYHFTHSIVFVVSFIFFLTAAHCLIGFPKGAYFIRLGDHHSEVREDSEIEIFIENWYIHEEFRRGQLMNNDIAVVLLKHPIQFTNYIQPICLPDKETSYEAGKNCTISGWGSIQYGKSSKFNWPMTTWLMFKIPRIFL